MAIRIVHLLAALAGLALTASASAQEVREPTPDERAKVESAVRDKLLDPESARFEDLRAVRRSERLVSICGRVNAKNIYGGYTGRSVFNVMISQADNDPTEEKVIAALDTADGIMMGTNLCKVTGLLD